MSNAPVIRIRAKVPTWGAHERLRKIRRDENLSTAQFAEKLGVNESTYSAWETGRNKVPDLIAVSENIEQVFGYSKFWVRGDLDTNGYTPGPEDPEKKLRSDNSHRAIVTQIFRPATSELTDAA